MDNTNKSNFYHLYRYVKERRLSILFIYIYTISIYGAWLSQNLVTFDAEGLYAVPEGTKWYLQWYQLGRWALVLLKKLMGVKLINPYFQISIFILFFPASVILWWFCFYKWNHFKENMIALLVFAGVYISHPIWSLQFAYRNQMEGITISMIFLPIAMLLLTDRQKEGKWLRTFLAGGLIITSFGTYQSFILVYAEAVAIYFLFRVYYDYTEGDKYNFWKEVLFFLGLTIICYILYIGISKALCIRLGIEYGSDYLKAQFHWGTEPISANIALIVGIVKRALTGDGIVYNKLAIIEVIVGCIMLGYVFRNRFRAGLVAFLVFIGTWIIPFMLVIVTAFNIVDRSQFGFVLVLSFWAAIEIGALAKIVIGRKYTDVGVLLLVFVIVCGIFPQIEKTTRLLYSDYMTVYGDEVQFRTIYYEALGKGASEGDIIVFVGGKPNFFLESALQQELVGYSYLEETGFYGDNKIIEAMRAYGMNVTYPSPEQRQYAAQKAESMEIWPDIDGILVEDGLIIVRLS